MDTQQGRCQRATDEGTPCESRAMGDSRFCYWHDPEREEERLAMLGRRGTSSGAPILAEGVPLNSIEDLQALLKQVALYLATSERIEPRRATALRAVTAELLKAFEIG